ncbi:AIM24 family protein [Rhodococcus sp. IEGM 1401]|uniref:AIM24 family protein n=1 Tax=unclassified Rhodococcus (in: high G+C Gram-positive bacteria) TaxID=192944 RepID=UPI0011EF620B|nr:MULTISPECIES: AIM24 family protein [unclassified Rhodococcus (in: high G+C Gram-positive bacteria)]KAA0924372.1 AIM24 family protein [Rhodococcus sp. ANT_H53B]MCZ4563858.1 AIM24 family protein [Rhodococcus sp. IEGM 1401]MDI9923991.1 AIM24 family protein [Rhodococcus sp. IEGM 1372]MDV8034764.1 AIM24 family protein [Rhodococcus sp. IEGM 1414]MDV8077018.1 AIM24 family protein [Rhodococcus sp. IEGM 1370]
MPLELVNSKVVKSVLTPNQNVLARRGSMLYYTGDVRFIPHSMGGGAGAMPGMGGVAGMAGRMMAGEHVAMMAAEGQGEVFYGHAGLYIEVIHLDGSSMLTVEADRLLVHDGYLQSSIVALTSQGGVRGAVRGAMTGQGLFTTQLTGQGSVAVLSHGGATPLQIGPDHPQVVVDPQAYVCHIGNINVDVSANVGWRDAVGKGSGEAIQLKMTGMGTVWVQASEQKF